MLRAWLKKRKTKRLNAEFRAAVPKVLARFGALVEKHPTAYMDETWLPLDKRLMKTILKAAYLQATTEQDRELAKVGWMMLANFQPGIGETPVDFVLPKAMPRDMATLDTAMRGIEPWLKIAPAAREEMLANRAELHAWLSELPPDAS